MQHKKFSGMLFITMLVFSLVLSACGGSGNATGTTTPTESGGAMATDTVGAPVEEATATSEMGGEATATSEMGGEATATTAGGTGSVGEIDCKGAAQGDTVSMLYQWSGQEEEKITNILKPLADACGIVFKPESTRDQAILDTRVQAGTPPDIAFWNVVQLQQYKDLLKPVTDLGVDAANYSDFWREIGSVDGNWLGLPVKADVKSIIWYSPVAFDAFGYTVPTTWDELNTLVEKMVADGNVPWALGFENGDPTGWTGSDFIEDILLVTQGPQYVQDIISGKVPYNDAGVKEAYEIYGKWAKDAKYTVGGAQGTLSTPFLNAIYSVFADPPEAMMVKQSGFAGGEIVKQYPNLKYGTDFDFFQVPGVQGLQGGSDWMMAFSDKPAVQAVYAYLSSEAGAKVWAEQGFDISPNTKAEQYYTDEALQKRAQMLYGAEALVPDIGDSIPGGFGSAEWKAIIDYVNGGDLDQALAAAAQVQAEATGGSQ